MVNGVYKITEEYEKTLSDYTGDAYVNNISNTLFFISLL